MTLFQDNLSPYLTVVEQGSTPANPSSGDQKLFVRSSDHVLCRLNSSGSVVPIGGLADEGAFTYLDATDAAAPGNPSAGLHRIYSKSGGLYYRDSAGTEVGPLGSGGGGGGGGLVLLEQHTASSSATLDFTTAITSTHDMYEIALLNVLPASDGVDLNMVVSTDGGSTWDTTSGHYSWEAARAGSNAGGAYSGTTSASAIIMQANTIEHVRNTGGGFSGQFRLYDPMNSSLYKFIEGTGVLYYNPGWIVVSVGGQYLQTTAVNAIRFLFSSGNIASGTIRMYGLAK